MNLYDINQSIEATIEAIYAQAEENEGIIPDDAIAQLDGLQEAFADKVENICLYIKNQIALQAAIKAEEKALSDRRKASEKKIEWLKSYLSSFVKNPMQTAKVKISFRKSKSVEIINEMLLEDLYCNIKNIRTPDKAMIKEYLEGGAVVEGACLVEKNNIQIK